VTKIKNTEETPVEMQVVAQSAPSAAPFYRRPQNHAETYWTAERDEELKRLFATGISRGAIYKKMGASSRGAVCGRIRRLGLTRDKGYEVLVARNRAARQDRTAAGAERVRGGSVKAVRTGKTSFKVIDFRKTGPEGFIGALVGCDDYVPRTAPDVPVEQRKTLLELTNETCRFPYNDPCEPGFYFCGDPSADLTGGRPYCRAHQLFCQPVDTNR